MSIFAKEQVVIALGGGGSRGLAHLGVLQALEDAEIPIGGIIGTSVGSIVGAAYALAPDASQLSERILEYMRSDRFQNDHFKRMMFGANDAETNFAQTIFALVRRSINFTNLIRRISIFKGERMRDTIREVIGEPDFNELKIPFAVPAIDLRPPEEVLLTQGSLLDAVVASCSLPGFFPPVRIDDMLLADVGVIGSVPVDAAHEFMPTALVIAVDLSSSLDPIEEIDRGWDAIMRVESIASSKLNDIELARADIVIRPDIGEKYWSDFTELARMIQAGHDAATEQLPAIKSKLRSWLRFIKR